jgi:hypothetical protein
MTDSLTAHSTPEVQKFGECPKQWNFLDPDEILDPRRQGTIRQRQRYLLKNSTNRHSPRYERQGTFGGINLGFSDNAEVSTAAKVVQWEFVNRNRTPVAYDEPVAIRCKDGYLRYGSRAGINHG